MYSHIICPKWPHISHIYVVHIVSECQAASGKTGYESQDCRKTLYSSNESHTSFCYDHKGLYIDIIHKV